MRNKTLKHKTNSLLQYMWTFSIHTSRSNACTPSTAVKIHPGDSQPPMKPHISPRIIPRLLHFNLSINTTYTDHNPHPTEHRQSTPSYFVIHLFFLITLPLGKEQMQVYYVLKPINIITYVLPCVWNTGFFSFLNYFLFLEREKKKNMAVS